MANPWFRLYAEFASDPKIQMMSEAYQRRFVMLLCMRCCNDNATLQQRIDDDAVAFQCRITQQEWQETKAVFLSKNLIDEFNNPVAWGKRQYLSDQSTLRSRACRERKKQAQEGANSDPEENATTCNVAATPPEQNRPEQTTDQTQTRTEQNLKNQPSVPTAAHEDGFSKNGIGGLGRSEVRGSRRGFVPSPRTCDEIISNCPGWNLQVLLEHYADYRASNGEPNHPQAAFIGWAKKFTGGKRPS